MTRTIDARFLATGHPRTLTLLYAAGQGDRALRGINLVDPLHDGGRLTPSTARSAIELRGQRVTLGGELQLFYPSLPIHVALIHATTADALGKLSTDDESFQHDLLTMAQAAHNSRSMVIAQVKRIVPAVSLEPNRVRVGVPGTLVDHLVIADDPQDHWMTFGADFDARFTSQPASRQVASGAGHLRIAQEGRTKKLVPSLGHLSFCGAYVAGLGREVIYLTERAVFRLIDGQLTLTEIAPGLDLQRDVLDALGAPVVVAADLQWMKARIFWDGLMLKAARQPGSAQGSAALTAAFFEPLPGDERKGWDGS